MTADALGLTLMPSATTQNVLPKRKRMGVVLHLDGQLIQWRELAIAGLSFAICVAAIFAARLWPRLAGRPADTSAVQSAHTRMTPRIGGVGILITIVSIVFYSPGSIKETYYYLALSSSFLFIAGFLEDLGFSVSPRNRLLAAIASSLSVIFLLGIWLPHLGISRIDHLASIWVIGIPLTLLITVGLANGFNLIDGVNGLAGLTAVIAAISMAIIARSAGVEDLAYFGTMLAAGVFGFWILNYPFGLIFLGDAGAYVIGFMLSWFGICILIAVPTVTPWAILLTVFWPVADTLLAIYRRKIRKLPNMQPDRLHVHQMVMRAMELIWLGRERRNITNPLTTLILAPSILAPAVTGVLLWDQPLYALLAVVLFSFLFVLNYFIAFPLLKKAMPNSAKRMERRLGAEADKEMDYA